MLRACCGKIGHRNPEIAVLLIRSEYLFHLVLSCVQIPSQDYEWNLSAMQVGEDLFLHGSAINFAGTVPGVVVGYVDVTEKNQIGNGFAFRI